MMQQSQFIDNEGIVDQEVWGKKHPCFRLFSRVSNLWFYRSVGFGHGTGKIAILPAQEPNSPFLPCILIKPNLGCVSGIVW